MTCLGLYSAIRGSSQAQQFDVTTTAWCTSPLSPLCLSPDCKPTLREHTATEADEVPNEVSLTNQQPILQDRSLNIE